MGLHNRARSMVLPLRPIGHLLLRALLIASAALLPRNAFCADRNPPGICRIWPQNRLIIDGLQSRRFMLEAASEAEPALSPLVVNGRKIYHRAFSLSLDVAEPIALFQDSPGKACSVARDNEKNAPLWIPVFFVGRAWQSADELKADAQRTAFAPSERLANGENFAEIQFYLRKGSWSFSDIRPFFACGKPGLMLCEGYCPGDSAALAESLIDSVVADAASPLPEVISRSTEPSPPILPAPPAAVPAPPPPAPGAPHATIPLRPLKRLVLALERKTGSAIAPADVLEAEGSIRIEGAEVKAADGTLIADLPEDIFARANTAEALRRLFRYHQISTVTIEASRSVLTAEPLFIRAADIAVTIADAAGKPAGGCNLALDVAPDRKIGRGWANAAAPQRTRGLKLWEEASGYALRLPAGVGKNELLIATAEAGAAARILNAGPGCELEARPLVSAEELRSGTISRLSVEQRPILIALVSTDSDFSKSLDAPSIDGFWSGALDLAGSVSEGPWQRKLLARAQFPGPSPETGILEDLTGGKLAGVSTREALIKKLIAGSHRAPGPLAIIGSEPIKRFHFDPALEPIRADAGLDRGVREGQEALLFISGGIDPSGSYFCRFPAYGEPAPWARLQWTKRVRRVFVLEAWSDIAAKALQDISRAQPAEGAPPGIYSCNFSGSDGVKILLYGVVPSALAAGTRGSAFGYLTARANSHLRP